MRLLDWFFGNKEKERPPPAFTFLPVDMLMLWGRNFNSEFFRSADIDRVCAVVHYCPSLDGYRVTAHLIDGNEIAVTLTTSVYSKKSYPPNASPRMVAYLSIRNHLQRLKGVMS